MFSKLFFALFTIIIAHTAMAQTLWPQRGTLMIAARTNGNQVLAVQDGRTAPGTRIVISNVQSAKKGAAIWSYRFDNMLINNRSGLALSVLRPNSTSGVAPGTNLTQQSIAANSTATSGMVQQWNYFAGSGQIHPGFAGDLCVTAGNQLKGGVASVEKCVGSMPEQSWTVVTLP